MKPKQLQMVYLPVNVQDERFYNGKEFCIDSEGEKRHLWYMGDGKWEGVDGSFENIVTWLKPTEAIIFTPEELNEYTQQVIKDALKVASEEVTYIKECGKSSYEKCYAVFCHTCDTIIDRKSITNTFEQIYEKWKIK